MKRPSSPLVAAGLGAALLLAVVPSAAAQQQTPPKPKTATTLTLSDPTALQTPGLFALTGTLTTADKKALSGKQVDFYQKVELMGPRDSYLGSATSDSTGAVALAYQPAEAGPQTILVRFAGADDLAKSEATRNVEFQSVVPPFEPEPLPLASVRQWLPAGLGSMVLITWAVLLGTFLSAVFAIRGAVSAPDPGQRSAAAVSASTPNP